MKCKILLAVLVLISCISCAQVKQLNYPSINKSIVSENIHGIEVVDDYRNLENASKDTLVDKWFADQTNFTGSYLDTIPTIKDLLAKMKSLANRTTSWAKTINEDDHGTLYYLKYPRDEDPYILFSRKKGDTQNEIELFNPNNYKKDSGNKYRIDYIKPSWDGKYVAIALNHSGNFGCELVILNTETKTLAEDYIINNSPRRGGGIDWLPNSSEFVYLHYPVVEKGKEGYKANSISVLHKLGQKNKRINVFGKETGIKFNPSFYPMTRLNSSKDKYILGFITSTTSNVDTYYATIESIMEGKPNWEKFYGAEEEIDLSNAVIKGDAFYFKTSKNASNFMINKLDIKNIDFSTSKNIVEENKEEVLSSFQVLDNSLYYSTMKNGVEALLYYKSLETGLTIEVKFPSKNGRIILVTPKMYGDDLYVETVGWANDLLRFHIKDGKIIKELVLTELPKFPEFKNFKVELLFVTGHDGVEIPVSMVYDSERSMKNVPLILKAYGAYGHNLKPSFNPTSLSWVAQGGILVFAHVRGGGEKGQAWHDAGKKSTKSNSWKDVISVTEHLIKEGYTNKDKIALWGVSAGGISTGMAMIERPDLYKVFLNQVPLLNPTRLTAGSYKQTSFVEFGKIDDPKESAYLIAMDPYLNLKTNVNYPATLLISGGKDDRLDAFETGKFIAKLQANKNATNPYLLYVDTDGTHKASSINSFSKIFGFAWWVINNSTYPD